MLVVLAIILLRVVHDLVLVVVVWVVRIGILVVLLLSHLHMVGMLLDLLFFVHVAVELTLLKIPTLGANLTWTVVLVWLADLGTHCTRLKLVWHTRQELGRVVHDTVVRVHRVIRLVAWNRWPLLPVVLVVVLRHATVAVRCAHIVIVVQHLLLRL